MVVAMWKSENENNIVFHTEVQDSKMYDYKVSNASVLATQQHIEVM